MKSLKILFGLISITVLLSSFVFLNPPSDEGGIKWHTFQEAVELNKKEKRKIYIDVFTQWCGWCKVMDKNTFTNPVIAKYINEHFYAVKLDAEMKDTVVFNNYKFINPNPNGMRSPHQLAASLLDNKLSYPSAVFLDENFNRLFYLQSYLSPQQFEPYIKFVGDNSYLTVTWDDYQKNFKSEIETPAPVVTPPSPH